MHCKMGRSSKILDPRESAKPSRKCDNVCLVRIPQELGLPDILRIESAMREHVGRKTPSNYERVCDRVVRSLDYRSEGPWFKSASVRTISQKQVASKGCVVEWLERLTPDLKVPGSNPRGVRMHSEVRKVRKVRKAVKVRKVKKVRTVMKVRKVRKVRKMRKLIYRTRVERRSNATRHETRYGQKPWCKTQLIDRTS